MKLNLYSKERFSDRVESYRKYRPGYPDDLIESVIKFANLTGQSVVADIGSGTGISSEPFVRRGISVVAVEPNGSMRRASEDFIKNRELFRTVDGSAEESRLDPASVDLVVAAQAFHWFDWEIALAEFRRILKPGGSIALMWNSRRTEGSKFLELYESMLLKHGTDYSEVNHDLITDEALEKFFVPSTLLKVSREYEQEFDFEGIKGRLTSSSYVPSVGDAGYSQMISALKTLFSQTAQNGKVQMVYESVAYLTKDETNE